MERIHQLRDLTPGTLIRLGTAHMIAGPVYRVGRHLPCRMGKTRYPGIQLLDKHNHVEAHLIDTNESLLSRAVSNFTFIDSPDPDNCAGYSVGKNLHCYKVLDWSRPVINPHATPKTTKKAPADRKRSLAELREDGYQAALRGEPCLSLTTRERDRAAWEQGWRAGSQKSYWSTNSGKSQPNPETSFQVHLVNSEGTVLESILVCDGRDLTQAEFDAVPGDCLNISRPISRTELAERLQRAIKGYRDHLKEVRKG